MRHQATECRTEMNGETVKSRFSLCGMDSEFIKKIYEAIHEESVRQQIEIINK